MVLSKLMKRVDSSSKLIKNGKRKVYTNNKINIRDTLDYRNEARRKRTTKKFMVDNDIPVVDRQKALKEFDMKIKMAENEWDKARLQVPINRRKLKKCNSSDKKKYEEILEKSEKELKRCYENRRFTKMQKTKFLKNQHKFKCIKFMRANNFDT